MPYPILPTSTRSRPRRPSSCRRRCASRRSCASSTNARRPMLDKAKKIGKQRLQIRREIHAHPELGFQEHQACQTVSVVLTALGSEHQGGVAKTGIVATLGDGHGPTVALRADM